MMVTGAWPESGKREASAGVAAAVGGDSDGGVAAEERVMMVTGAWPESGKREVSAGVAAAVGGDSDGGWRMKASDIVDRVDQVIRIVFGFGRKTRQKTFSAAAGGRRWWWPPAVVWW
nr:hypothetical protein [Tanacetum cinerariifolium]